MEKLEKTLTELITDIIKSLNESKALEAYQQAFLFKKILEQSGRSEQKNAIELIANNRKILGDEMTDKMTEQIENLLDVYGKLN